ncbi:MAG: AAA family ATPase [Bacilli bacterium]|nr:AAA family ATPase [Bacilli bacterium]
MKLLSLHINNYGKFSNYNLKFDDLTSICENNGFGKSTLSSFIKAMFYGLDKVTSTSAKFLDRKHYLPFKGGIYGGNIEFEFNGNTYRIERTFDSKSNTKDTMNVYCNNTQDNSCLGDIPGNTVFGINRDSFERLISINSDKITIETDDDINKKLNNYVENIGEEFDIEVVKKRIKDTTKNNEKRIKELKESIKNLDLDISEKESKKENLDKYLYDKLNSAQVLKNEAEKKYEEAAGLGALVEKWKNYKQMVLDLKEKNNQKKKYEFEYSKIPSIEMIRNAKLVDKKISSLKEVIQNNRISEVQLSNYESLKRCFKNKPDEDTLDDISKKIKKYNKLEINVSSFEDVEEFDEEKELNKHFYGESIESLKNVQKGLEKDVNEYIEAKEKTIPVVVQKTNQNNSLSKLFFIIGLVLFVIGVVCIFINITVAFALFINIFF